MRAVLLYIISVLMFLVPVSFVKADITSNMAAWWSMDSSTLTSTTVLDISGNGNTARLMGAVKPSTATGQISEALSFPGGTSWASTSPAASLNITGAITLAAWVKPNSGTNVGLVAKSCSTTCQPDYGFILNDANVIWRLNKTASDVSSEANSVPFNEWTFVVGTYNLTTQKIYINGIQSGADKSFSTAITNTANSIVYLGNYYNTGGMYALDGLLDDVRIYTRALTDAEVLDLYNYGVSPVVTIQSATSVTGTSATLNANLTGDGYLASTTDRGFYYGTTLSYGSTASSTGTFELGAFSETITGLVCNTTYHVAAFATNNRGTGTTTDTTFTTANECAPTVVTSSAIDTGQYTTTLAASISSTGGIDATAHGFAYGTSATLVTGVATTTLGSFSGTGSFQSELSDLSCNTTYYYRAYATNSSGTGLGTIQSLTTSACDTEPDPPTSVAAVAGNAQVTVSFEVPVNDGGDAIIRYTVTSSPGSITAQGESSPIIISGLTNGTSYTFTVTATNGVGTSSASAASDAVIPVTVPTVTSSSAGSISATAATLDGSITATGGLNGTASGFAWGTYPLLTTAATTSEGSYSDSGSLSSAITGLSCGTTYYFRGYATNSVGTGYSSIISFATPECESPPVSRSSSSRRTANTASVAPSISQDTLPQTSVAEASSNTNTIVDSPVLILAADSSAPVQTLTLETVTEKLPEGLAHFFIKFPEMVASLVEQGISEVAELSTLGGRQFTLPDITNLKELPVEVVMARNSNGKIGITSTVTLKDSEVEQRIKVVANTEIALAVRPQGVVDGVKGYLAFTQSARSTVTREQISMVAAAYAAIGAQGGGEPETELVYEVTSFEYVDPDGDGIYTSSVKIPPVEGDYEIITVLKYKDEKLGTKQLRLVAVVDPEGYVYELVRGQQLRIANALVTIYHESGIVWDAAVYKQENPRVTDITGDYSFLVPEGRYYIRAEAEGYKPYISSVFDVKAERGVHFDIQMKREFTFLSYLSDIKVLSILVLLGGIAYMFYRMRRQGNSTIRR